MSALMEFICSTEHEREDDGYLILTFKGFAILFSVATLISSYLYLDEYNYTGALLKIVNLMTIGCIASLLLMKKIKVSFGLLMLLLTISINFYVTIIYESMNPDRESERVILFYVTLCIVPVILCGITHYSYVSLFVSTGSICSYLIACVLFDNFVICGYVILLFIIMVGISVFFWYTERTYRSELERKKVKNQQEEILSYFELEPEQWQILKNTKMSSEDTHELLENMGKQMREKIINEAKVLVYNDEAIIEAITRVHDDLTASELEICCHIVNGKTVNEICNIRNVSPSTVTSVRSRLRTKMGLAKKDNLKRYLRSLVGGN